MERVRVGGEEGEIKKMFSKGVYSVPFTLLYAMYPPIPLATTSPRSKRTPATVPTVPSCAVRFVKNSCPLPMMAVALPSVVLALNAAKTMATTPIMMIPKAMPSPVSSHAFALSPLTSCVNVLILFIICLYIVAPLNSSSSWF